MQESTATANNEDIKHVEDVEEEILHPIECNEAYAFKISNLLRVQDAKKIGVTLMSMRKSASLHDDKDCIQGLKSYQNRNIDGVVIPEKPTREIYEKRQELIALLMAEKADEEKEEIVENIANDGIDQCSKLADLLPCETESKTDISQAKDIEKRDTDAPEASVPLEKNDVSQATTLEVQIEKRSVDACEFNKSDFVKVPFSQTQFGAYYGEVPLLAGAWVHDGSQEAESKHDTFDQGKGEEESKAARGSAQETKSYEGTAIVPFLKAPRIVLQGEPKQSIKERSGYGDEKEQPNESVGNESKGGESKNSHGEYKR